MPLYEYECRKCHHRLEKIQKFSDPPEQVCPQCGKKALERLISPAGIRFKGSGWYETDYGRKTQPETEKPKEEVKVEAKERAPAKGEKTGTRKQTEGQGKRSDSSKQKT